MSLEALVAILGTAACLLIGFGLRGMFAADTRRLDHRLRYYSGRAFQLSDEEQKQAASVQVTRLLDPSGVMSKAVSLRDLNGFSNRRSTRTFAGEVASMISMRPWPALRLPDHSYVDPVPDSGPE